MTKFADYFGLNKNTIFEKANFHKRNQRADETVEEYVRALYELAEKCDFENKRDEQMRDRIVIGIQDASISQDLQLEKNLTLTKAVETARAAESVKGQNSTEGAAAANPANTKRLKTLLSCVILVILTSTFITFHARFMNVCNYSLE